MDLKDKKILLTGGKGFLGFFVEKELLNRGVKKENIFIPDLPEFDLRNKEVCKRVYKI